MYKTPTRESFAVHYWNKMRLWSKGPLLIDPVQPLYKIFKSNCPITEKLLLRNMIGDPY